MKEKFSSFAHFFEKNDTVAIYNSLNHNLLFMEKKEFQKFSKLLPLKEHNFSLARRKFIADFRGAGMIVPGNENENKKVIKLQESILSTPWINTLYLLITNNCNFGCTYCFFNGSYFRPNEKSAFMSEETAIRSIRKFAEYLKQAEQYSGFPALRPNVIFYGGEPFLNPKIFKSAVLEIESLKKSGKLPSDTMININSNGSLITDEIAEFCAKHNIEVDVSLDGYQAVHDASRLWRRQKKGTFNAVVDGINRLKKFKTNMCISCTVAESNVDELPEIFEWFIDDLGISNIGFNPLLDSHQYKVGKADYYRKISTAMIKCYEIARKRGAYEERIMRKVRAFVDGTIYDRDCCGCGQQIVVSPDGSMGVCHAYTGTKKYFISPNEQLNPYEHPFWNEWSGRSPINMPACHNCEALVICGGGCPHNADVQQGSIWKFDEGFCVHAKETLKWLIWDLHGHMK